MITAEQVNDFKEIYCDENKIIPEILKDEFSNLIQEPILDVGSGLGEISSIAFKGKDVLHIDMEDFSFHKIDESHSRIVKDFFDFIPYKKYNTILLSHTLQFLDENIEELLKKVKEIDPKYFILVRNTNDDFMGDLINFFDSKNIKTNPERIINEFPKGFNVEKTINFTANLKCKDYSLLALQISYLWDTRFSEDINNSLLEFLKLKLEKPEFTIHQEIILFVKE